MHSSTRFWFKMCVWWCTLLVPALGTQRQTDLCDFEASLNYKTRFLIARAPQRSLEKPTNHPTKPGVLKLLLQVLPLVPACPALPS